MNFIRTLLLRPWSKLNARALAIAVILALAFNLFASRILNASYADSQFPVPYQVAQLSFDHQKLKGWYAFLIDRGTMGTYVQTQHIDFIFIVSVFVLHLLALLLIARLFPPASKGRRWMETAAVLSTLAPIADALENLVSYAMLAQPLDFSPWLALVYSSLAALKFGMFTFAYAAAVLGLGAALAMMLSRKLASRRAA
jgi:hypothetical protein